MPTPWLSWPRRFASTRCSATMAASAGELPPAVTMRFVSASSLAWSIIMFLSWSERKGAPGASPCKDRQASGQAEHRPRLGRRSNRGAEAFEDIDGVGHQFGIGFGEHSL